MDKNTTPRILLARSQNVIRVWKEDPTCHLQGASLKMYEATRKELEELLERIDAVKRQLKDLMAERDRNAELLNELTVRFRCMILGRCGPDSQQYILLGPGRKRRRPARHVSAR